MTRLNIKKKKKLYDVALFNFKLYYILLFEFDFKDDINSSVRIILISRSKIDSFAFLLQFSQSNFECDRVVQKFIKNL